MMLSKLHHSTNTTYTPAGRVCRKEQGDPNATKRLLYSYNPNNAPHAVRRIYNGLTNELSNLRWDNNGNLAQQTLYSVNNNVPTYLNMRMLFWDEDDRLNLVAGDGYLSYYAYGHDGNRAIKMTGNAAIDQSGTLLNSTNLENITLYPNEYLAVTQAEYTKYYYAGGNRIASKIGTGGFEKMQRLCTQDLNLSADANTLFSNVLQQIINTANQPNDEYPVNTCGGYNVATELLTSQLPDFYISNTALNFTQNNPLQQFRQNLAGGTEAVYYFHSDHLGSASWITNNTGLPVQHLLYLPFGEHFANERSAAYDERFTFTGKERDAETGFYYHGARFNSSDIGWLSVDPMSDKYPSLTPYAYCAWNPVKLVDPEGEDIYFFDDNGYYFKKVEKKGEHKLAIYSSKKNEDGSYTSQTSFYYFADPINDPKAIDDGEIDHITFVSETEIKKMLKQQGAFTASIKDFITQSGKNGNFDYSHQVLKDRYNGIEDENGNVSSSSLFITSGDRKVHNLMNFGNYLWAATGYVVGFDSPKILKVGGDAYSLFTSFSTDSKDDKCSIDEGFRHAKRNGYRFYK